MLRQHWLLRWIQIPDRVATSSRQVKEKLRDTVASKVANIQTKLSYVAKILNPKVDSKLSLEK